MAKSRYNSVYSSPIVVEFQGFGELENLIDDLRELLSTADRGQFSMTASMYDELLKIRDTALRELIQSAESRLTYNSYKLDNNASEEIIEDRRVNSEKDAA